jgi:pimeloyl-ACP methyl ester carboxylesterase
VPRARANGIELEYDTLGARGAEPVLLIMGLGGQLVAWTDAFCEALAAHGHFVIRFDNRDVGLSTKLDGVPCDPVLDALRDARAGKPVRAAYRLSDMAADAAGLLDALGLARAHVVGTSLGGMIAQTLAIEHPARVRTLTSIMSTTGERTLPPAKPEAMAVLMTPAPTEREAAIEHGVRVYSTIGSPGYPPDEAELRALLARAFDRGVDPEGVARQLVAILASGSRRDALGSVRAPALVIHGLADPLVPVEGGRDTAACIPGAELMEIEGMGHDLPRALWPTFVDAIAKHTARG